MTECGEHQVEQRVFDFDKIQEHAEPGDKLLFSLHRNSWATEREVKPNPNYL